uniref:Putative DNA binding, helix-turn-helix domain containing protein n=1 Tax=viral metagenome TaxID=1070528 RepID=A0A6M3J303_9ZZZZ
MEVKFRNKRLSITDQVSVVTDYNGGMSVKDILEKYKISRGTLYNILKKQI